MLGPPMATSPPGPRRWSNACASRSRSAGSRPCSASWPHGGPRGVAATRRAASRARRRCCRIAWWTTPCECGRRGRLTGRRPSEALGSRGRSWSLRGRARARRWQWRRARRCFGMRWGVVGATAVGTSSSTSLAATTSSRSGRPTTAPPARPRPPVHRAATRARRSGPPWLQGNGAGAGGRPLRGAAGSASGRTSRERRAARGRRSAPCPSTWRLGSSWSGGSASGRGRPWGSWRRAPR
mmetsp:Transcript_33117/g.92188  ORF Transcript_33117/g.92188 Transcript_33117/m.92188 type:complete len:239 (+) Transcript_33117:174-890(+)